MIGLEGLKQKYKLGDNFFRTILCRPEFNQFRTKDFFVMDDSYNFHKMLQHIIKIKKHVILLFLLFNTQIAFCQHYEPVIIYSPSGEPQTMIKGKIIYDNYGLPKSHIQTKRSLRGFCQK